MEIQPIFHFLLRHWILSLAFMLVLLAIFIEEAKSRGLGGGQVNPDGAINLINRKEALVLDIRSQEAFKKGSIIGAMNIPKEDLKGHMNRLQTYQNKPLIVVCERGNDANRVALTLRRKGLKHPLVLAGGIQSWIAAKLPLTKKHQGK